MAALTPEQIEALSQLLTTISEQLPDILEKLNQTTTAAGSSADSAAIIAQKLLQGKDAAATAAEAASASLGIYESLATNSEKYATQIEAISKALGLITTELKNQRDAIPAGVDAEITKLQRTLTLRKQNLQAVKDTGTAVNQTTRQLRDAENRAASQPAGGGGGGLPGMVMTMLQQAAMGAQGKKRRRKRRDRDRERNRRKRRRDDGGGGGGGGLVGSVGGFLGELGIKAGETLQEKLSTAYGEMETQYKGVSTQSTELVKYTGLVMNADTMVRRHIAGQKTFAETMIGTQERLQALGVTMEGVKTGYKSLIDNSFTFRTEMSKNTKESRRNLDNVARYAIAYEKMGLSTESFGKTLDVLSKTYGRTNITKDTREFGEQLMHIARTTGKIPTQVATDFTTFMDGIGSAYSFEKAQKIFKNLSLTSAETGVAMDKLLKGVEGFDTLDTAAERVGELNAMLGGPYLNTLDMVNASEDDRIKMLQAAAKESGVSFESLKKFGKLSVGEKMGFDPQSAMRLMRGRTDAEKADSARRRQMIHGDVTSYDKLKGSMEDGAIRNAVSITDSFAAAKEGLHLVEGAYTEVDEAAVGMAGTLRNLGMATSQFISETVTDMLTTLTTGIAWANNQMDDGNALGALGTFFLTTELYKRKALVKMAEMLGEGLPAEATENTEGASPSPAATEETESLTSVSRTTDELNEQERTAQVARRGGTAGGTQVARAAEMTATIPIYLGNQLLDDSTRKVIVTWMEEVGLNTV